MFEDCEELLGNLYAVSWRFGLYSDNSKLFDGQILLSIRNKKEHEKLTPANKLMLSDLYFKTKEIEETVMTITNRILFKMKKNDSTLIEYTPVAFREKFQNLHRIFPQINKALTKIIHFCQDYVNSVNAYQKCLIEQSGGFKTKCSSIDEYLSLLLMSLDKVDVLSSNFSAIINSEIQELCTVLLPPLYNILDRLHDKTIKVDGRGDETVSDQNDRFEKLMNRLFGDYRDLARNEVNILNEQSQS